MVFPHEAYKSVEDCDKPAYAKDRNEKHWEFIQKVEKGFLLFHSFYNRFFLTFSEEPSDTYIYFVLFCFPNRLYMSLHLKNDKYPKRNFFYLKKNFYQ